eukprot:Hpha_TRINITY_DN35598_c0_g1::TRINITY_DN35598_c0_g1_i1::g.84460::m.84460
MPVLESLAAVGTTFGAGWNTAFGGKVGAWIEASVVCVVSAIATDLIAQSSEMTHEALKDEDEEDKIDQRYDCPRVTRYAFIGSLYGPVEYIYFIGINKAFPWWGQVMFDNFIFIPFMTAGGIIINIMLRDADEMGRYKVTVCEEFNQKMFDTLKVGMPMWLVLDCIMFTVIPLRHRVAFSRIGGFGYLIWCSHVLNNPHTDPTEKWVHAKGSETDMEAPCSRCPSPRWPTPPGPRPFPLHSHENTPQDNELSGQGRS